MVDRDLDDELQHHLDLLIDGYVAAGMSPGDARRRAVREMGALTGPVEACRSIILATVGVYGLVAHVIGQQRRESAIRAALGATRGSIAEQVLWQGARLVCAGVLAGGLTAVAVNRLASGYLFGITSRDPLTYGVAVGVTMTAAMLAVAVVARRAAHVDPSQTLRQS